MLIGMLRGFLSYPTLIYTHATGFCASVTPPTVADARRDHPANSYSISLSRLDYAITGGVVGLAAITIHFIAAQTIDVGCGIVVRGSRSVTFGFALVPDLWAQCGRA